MKQHKDERGIIKDLLIGKKGAVTYITFKKGAVRGNHYHLKTIQHDFILSGRLQCFNDDRSFEVEAGDMITHLPGEMHAYKALKDAEIVSCVYGVRVGENYAKDTIKLMEPLI